MIGLHADALEQYREVLKLAPGNFVCRGRVNGILDRMRDPARSDTVRLGMASEDSVP